MSTTPIGTTWDAIVAALNGLGTAQLVLIMVAVVAAVWTLGRVFALVEVLVRGHTPADTAPDVEDLVEAFGIALDDALPRHLGDLASDLRVPLDSLTDAVTEDVGPRDTHRTHVEELLADLLAAQRATTLAVTALDDDEEFDPDGAFDPAVARAQLSAYVRAPKEYGAAFGDTRVPSLWPVAPAADEPKPSTRLHELAIEAAAADADARGIDLAKREDGER